jgi:transposase-like protein
MRSRVQSQLHALLADLGVIPELTTLFGPAGRRWLADLQLPVAARGRLDAGLRLVDAITVEVTHADADLRTQFAGDSRTRRLLPIPGIGLVTAATVVAEVWDIQRFEPSRVGCRFLVMKDGDMPKTYDPEFKARAVRLVRDHLADYGSVTAASFAVGAQLGVSRETLRRWVAQAEVDDGARPGLTTAEADELRRLRAENKRLREANEILKAASIFFAGELDSRNR